MGTERKNIHRNKTRPHVSKEGMVQTQVMRRHDEKKNLTDYERWLLAHGLY